MIRMRLAMAGAPAVDNEFFLQVVSLLSPKIANEKRIIHAIQSFFVTHPEQGRAYYYPILGYDHELDVRDISLPRVRSGEWDSDSLRTLISFLHLSLLGRIPKLKRIEEGAPTLQMNVSVVTFVHCQLGKDRTGAVVGAYEMAHKNQTLKSVLIRGKEEYGRAIDKRRQKSMFWYCMSIKLGVLSMVSRPDLPCREDWVDMHVEHNLPKETRSSEPNAHQLGSSAANIQQRPHHKRMEHILQGKNHHRTSQHSSIRQIEVAKQPGRELILTKNLGKPSNVAPFNMFAIAAVICIVILVALLLAFFYSKHCLGRC